jgi:hypothetical protein
MFENTVLIFIAVLPILAYYFFFHKKNKNQDFKKGTHLQSNSEMMSLIQQKSDEALNDRIALANTILKNSNEILIYDIPLEADIEVIETNECLLIKGSTKSLNSLCDFFAAMEQLPQGYGLQLGNWEFIVLNNYTISSIEEKKIILPQEYWLFMSCKFKDSISGEDIHPYLFDFEPYSFKKVLDYGIVMEATDYQMK